MAISLLPTVNTLRKNKFALSHNWTFTMIPSMLKSPIFMPIRKIIMNFLEGQMGGGVSINCTSADIPKSAIKIIRDKIHGIDIQQVGGRESMAGEITLEFLDAHDLRIFHLFEIWKQILADRQTGNPSEGPFGETIDGCATDGVVLTLYDDNRLQPRTIYNLLDTYCKDVTHSKFTSEETFITTTVTLSYGNYELIDRGSFAMLSTIPNISIFK